MRFEHIIEINTPGAGMQLAIGETFTREQLWRGLLVRMNAPQQFPNGPDGCECVQAQPGLWQRTLHFGPHTLLDQVRLQPEQHLMEFTPEPHGEATPIRLTMGIEEPQAGQMVLRFVYEALAELSAEEAHYNGYRQSAWLHNDMDMVRTLREWLAQGLLSGPAH
jgi:Domain of unknown function (DUF1857)